MFSSNTSQVSNAATYIEDVFSTWLYTGNGSTQTINNGIDLAGKGGLTWIKRRNAVANHALFDTARGATKKLYSDLTNAEYTDAYSLTAFNSNGFSLNLDGSVNNGSGTYASWTFRKQPKFFDVVTYTGNGATTRSIAHALGSTPGCIIVKRTDASGYNWYVYHRSLGTNGSYPNYMYLNTTDGEGGGFYAFFSAAPTSTDFSVGYYSGSGGAASLNVNGATYVAYLFAHNAGGFGLSGTDNVISCGGFTVSGGATTTVNLGYEPQWVLIKRVDTTGNWELFDSMRGFTVDFNKSAKLFPNLSDAESAPGGSARVAVTSTGFQYNPVDSADQMIYIAIRRGPMKTPTSGTSVFNAFAGADTSAITTNFPVDFFIENARVLNSANSATGARLLGGDVALVTSSTAATQTGFFSTTWYQSNTSYLPGCFGTAVAYAYRRAPGFFDEVCYTGAGSPTTVTHNLGVVPELMIIKRRDAAASWAVYSAATGTENYLLLNSTNAAASGSLWNSTTPTSSQFYVSGSSLVSLSGGTYVAYLFASCPGVSKVGTYNGNGSTQTINCGFTGGARFVLIKRTDSTGDWYVWDTARGIVSANDPRLSLNTTSAEVTTDDSIDPDNSGFIVNQVSATNINVSSATYIYLAIA